MSRIQQVDVSSRKPNAADYEIPADFDLRQHARSRTTWQLGDAPTMEAIVEFRTLTGPIVAAAGLGEPMSAATADGITRRRFVVRRRDAFARWLLSFGGDVIPVEPPALVE